MLLIVVQGSSLSRQDIQRTKVSLYYDLGTKRTETSIWLKHTLLTARSVDFNRLQHTSFSIKLEAAYLEDSQHILFYFWTMLGHQWFQLIAWAEVH